MRPTDQNLIDSIDLDACQISILPGTSPIELRQAEFHPSEWTQAMAIQAPRRREEYLRTRWLLHRLLGTENDFSRSPQGMVNWPPPWLGSISHSQGHVAIALCNDSANIGIGLDLENLDRVRPELSKKICRDEEWKALTNQHQGTAEKLLIARVFAAKEALYKAVYPTGLRQFWFEDAELISLSEHLDQGEIKLLIDAAPNAKIGKTFAVRFIEKQIGGSDFVAALCQFSND
jgi:enterobactin synthetase component D